MPRQDEGGYYHALNVTMLALILGREAKLSPDEMRALGLGTLLHEIGKEKVPSQILLKKSPWTTAERNFYQQHVVYGVEMAKQLPKLPAAALAVIAQKWWLLRRERSLLGVYCRSAYTQQFTRVEDSMTIELSPYPG